METAAANSISRKHIHIINPASGRGESFISSVREQAKLTGSDFYISEKFGHVEKTVREALQKEPTAHIISYGGDGTVYEVVNGIMNSGCAATASFSVVPAGSGNDFSSYANSPALYNEKERPIDLIRVTSDGKTRYFANMMNIGFDCAVVRETYSLKKSPLFRGSMAYIAGVVKVLAVKKTIKANITLSGVESSSDCDVPLNKVISYDKDILLTACANGKFCGGGFMAAPLAEMTDGIMDVLVVNGVSRRKFLSLVGDYRSGTYINSDGKMKNNFYGTLSYIKCRKMEITGPEYFCLDGEIFETGSERTITAEVIPDAVRFIPTHIK